jgi:outer membrane protein assembly factor BamB
MSGRPGEHDNVAVTRAHRFVVLALDRADGSVAWQTTVNESVPYEGGHQTGSLASASPVTDGERVYAFFGSRGLYALDAASGEVMWSVQLGEMFTKHGHGEGSSPVLHGETLAVAWDQEDPSFVAAFDRTTGRELWRTPRNHETSWSSPVAVEHGGQTQLVLAATDRLDAYDLATGAPVWHAGGLASNVVATPVAADGVVVAGSSYEKRSMIAVKLDGATGDVTGTPNLLWTRTQRTPYVPSPLYYQGHLFFLMHYQGVLTRADPLTGQDRGGPYRLFGMRDVYASPVAAGGRVYITDRTAGTLVIDADNPTNVLAVNELDDRFSATPALAGPDLVLRGEKRVYCLAED